MPQEANRRLEAEAAQLRGQLEEALKALAAAQEAHQQAEVSSLP